MTDNQELAALRQENEQLKQQLRAALQDVQRVDLIEAGWEVRHGADSDGQECCSVLHNTPEFHRHTGMTFRQAADAALSSPEGASR